MSKRGLFEKQFVKEITTNVDMLRKLYTFKNFHAPEISFLVEALTILSTNLGTFDQMIFHLLTVEFENNKKNILRQNTITTKILDKFIEKNLKNYLKLVLKEPLSIVLGDKGSIEIEKNKVLKELFPKNTTRFKELSPVSIKYQKVYSNVKKNAELLSKTINLFCDYAFSDDSANLFPFNLKIICRYIYDLSNKFECPPLPRVGALVMLRIFSPAILFPIKKKILKKSTPINAIYRRKLLLIAKSMQTLANKGITNDVSMKNIEDCLKSQSDRADKYLKSLCISKTEIKDKRKEYLKLLSYVKLDQTKFNDLALFLHNFFLYKKIIPDVFKLPEFKSKTKEITLKRGDIVFCALYKVKNPKKKKLKANVFTYANIAYSKEEKMYKNEIEKIWKNTINVGKNRPNFGEMTICDSEMCNKLKVEIRVKYVPYKATYFFMIVKTPFMDRLCFKFLEELAEDYEPKRSSYQETIETMHDKVVTYNEGKKINPKDLAPFLNFRILGGDENDEKEEGEEEGDDVLGDDDGGRRSIFKHIPEFQKVKANYGKQSEKKGSYTMFNSMNSRSVNEEW